VFGPDTSEIAIANQSEIYQGCYGIAAITIKAYVKVGTNGDPDRHALTFYLSAFQKTKDGERLVSSSDHSKLFKAVGRAKPKEGGEDGGAEGGRRRRKG